MNWLYYTQGIFLSKLDEYLIQIDVISHILFFVASLSVLVGFIVLIHFASKKLGEKIIKVIVTGSAITAGVDSALNIVDRLGQKAKDGTANGGGNDNANDSNKNNSDKNKKNNTTTDGKNNK